ncbi:MAG: phage tail protein, partial [Moraxella sp.]|nr:phage tail protein [Moraxella sp.]
MTHSTTVFGNKKGQQAPRQAVIAKDSAASISHLKVLYGLGEGEILGLVDGAKSIYLDDTPVLNDNGQPNFTDGAGGNGVKWEFRTGTNEQDYIKGLPAVESETNINLELKQATPFVRAINNSELSAVRVRMRFGALSSTNANNGDVSGTQLEYHIDVQTDGGAWQTMVRQTINDKTSAGYEKSHRIDLPRGKKWTLRVRRLTADSTSNLLQNKTYIAAITEVIDVKLRYPNTAMLFLQYNAATFSSIAKLAVHMRGRIIRVPSNYNATTRTYNGLWDGTFVQSYSNNPAWVYYDILTHPRFGLGRRISDEMVDKWSLYTLGQYCDEMVDDGKGGTEPRFAVNVYLQAQSDAYSVLQQLASIFRAISFWDGDNIVLDADVPKDAVYAFSNANVIDGDFVYTGTAARDRATVAKVAWDNPANGYKTEYEFVRDDRAISRHGQKVVEINLMGCTSQAQAVRAGRWALKSEQLETTTVAFKTGLDGYIPQVGNVITVADMARAGRMLGGRVLAVQDKTITLDRAITATVGDSLLVNGDDGMMISLVIAAMDSSNTVLHFGKVVTNISTDNAWAVATSELVPQLYRVMSIKQDDDNTFAITALAYAPAKFDAIDHNAHITPTPISVIRTQSIDSPTAINISSRTRTLQGQAITTLVIDWTQVTGATSYELSWQKDNGAWIKLPTSLTNSTEIDGVYSGVYRVRVVAVGAFDIKSIPATSEPQSITGKIGKPTKLAKLTVQGVLFGMVLAWQFGAKSDDTNFTEIQVSPDGRANISTLGTFAYPTNKHEITGLQGNLT